LNRVLDEAGQKVLVKSAAFAVQFFEPPDKCVWFGGERLLPEPKRALDKEQYNRHDAHREKQPEWNHAQPGAEPKQTRHGRERS
jgi:hypothetical protein